MMSKNNLKFRFRKILLIMCASFILLLASFLNFKAIAETPYVPLAPLPQTTVADGSTNLSNYLAGGFKLGIAIAGVLAFLMIVIGGFQYLSTDAMTGKEEGKERIERAVGGLVLALASYIILYTINPNLVELDLEFGRQLTQSPELTRPPSPSEQQLQQFIDAQNARMAAAGATADEQEALAYEMLNQAQDNYAILSDEEIEILEENAYTLLSDASLSRSTHSIATAGNLGANAVADGNLVLAQSKLDEVKQLFDNGLKDLQLKGDMADKKDALLNQGTGRYATLAHAIAQKDIMDGNVNIANRMMADIDAIKTRAIINASTEAAAYAIRDRLDSQIERIKQLCKDKSLSCWRYSSE